MTTVFTGTTLTIPTAPPTQLIPSSAGVAVPAGLHSWVLKIDTVGLGKGTPLVDCAVEFRVGGVWVQDTAVRGAEAGPYDNGSTVWVLRSTIGGVAGGALVGTYPSHVRVRIDKSARTTFALVALDIT